MIKVKVGRFDNPQNHVKINDSSVSFDHLEVEQIDEDTLLIRDIGSTNETWIDGISKVESKFTEDQTIKIGHQKFTGEEFFNKVRRFFIPPRVVWTDDFEALEKQFILFEKEKEKISRAFQLKMLLLRSGVILLIAGFFILYGTSLGIPPEIRIIATTIGGVLVVFISPYIISKDQLKSKLLEKQKEYRRKLRCPRCKADLTSKDYKYWKTEKRCRICDAVWVD